MSRIILGYLDPGSGSMILQAILGGVAGFLVALKMFGRRMLSFFTFWKREDKAPRDASAETDG